MENGKIPVQDSVLIGELKFICSVFFFECGKALYHIVSKFQVFFGFCSFILKVNFVESGWRCKSLFSV